MKHIRITNDIVFFQHDIYNFVLSVFQHHGWYGNHKWITTEKF